jgi:vacuolar-type H+-ATPase subunit C/Vma6
MENLLRGDYADKVSLLSPEKASASDLNNIFSEIYVYRLLYLIKIASGPIKKFLDAFTRRVEVDNVKKIVRAKFFGLDVSMDDLVQLPRTYSLINYQAMIEAPSLDEALNLLGFTIYKRVVDKIGVARDVGSPIPLEAYLDSIYFKNVFKFSKDVPDRNVVENVVGTELDFRNIYYIMAYKILDVPSRVVGESILYPLYRLSKEDIDSLVKAREESVIEILNNSRYGWVIPSIMDAWGERSIEKLEYSFNIVFKRFLDGISVKHPLGLGFVLWYLYNIGYEYMNLTAISIGKFLGIKPEEIRLII